MTDDREDRFDEFLRTTAQEYHRPPEVPKEELWARIGAARRAAEVAEPKKQTLTLRPRTPVRRWSVRPAFRYAIAAAALLAVGVALGRLSLPVADGPAGRPAAEAAGEVRPERAELATRLVAVEHLTEVDAFLTEFRSGRGEFTGPAQGLLGTTRLLLDSRRVSDPRLHRLLEDLEIVLAQIATFDSTDRRNELDLIADGIAETQLRARLKSAIPAGPITQM
ncbi:MAG: hypothetical protein ACRENB_15170 [Gemmatimonadales bacterium]